MTWSWKTGMRTSDEVVVDSARALSHEAYCGELENRGLWSFRMQFELEFGRVLGNKIEANTHEAPH